MAYNAWSRMDVPTYSTPGADPRFAHELDLTMLQDFTLKAADLVRKYVSPRGIDEEDGPTKRAVSLKEVRRELIPRLNDLLQKELHAHRPFASEAVPPALQVRASRGTHYGQFLRKTVDTVLKSEGYAFSEAHHFSGYSWKG